MALLLAPMEGLLDFTLRDALTRVGGLDRCVSEFIRVTDAVLPERAYVRVIPELRQGSRTSAGVPPAHSAGPKSRRSWPRWGHRGSPGISAVRPGW